MKLKFGQDGEQIGPKNRRNYFFEFLIFNFIFSTIFIFAKIDLFLPNISRNPKKLLDFVVLYGLVSGDT